MWHTGRLLACVAVLVVVMGAVFGSVRKFEFLHWDDPANVTENPYLHPPTWEHLGQLWQAPYKRLYVPVAYTFFWGEARFHQLVPSIAMDDGTFNPAVFHLGNLTLHTLCVLLVFGILRRVVEHDMAALAGALLFGLHPLQCESIGWITETRGLTSALLALIALWLFLGFGKSSDDETVTTTRWTAVLRMLLATAAFGLSILAKPTSVAVPLIVLVVLAGWKPWMLRRNAAWLVAWIALAVACVVGTKMLQPDDVIPSTTALWTRPLIATDSLAFYLYKTVLPWPLGVDYGRSPPDVLSSIWPYVAWLVPCVLIGLLWRLPHCRWWLTAFGVYVVALLPSLGLVPFRFQEFSTVADRYTYLAMLGPALAVAWLLVEYRRLAAWGTASFVLVILAILSVIQIGYWHDDEVLFEHARSVNPSSHLAYTQLGGVREARGDVNGAAQLYARAIQLKSDSIAARNNLGRLLDRSGRYEEAIEHYRHILEHAPELLAVRTNLAIALAHAGRHEEAHVQFETVLEAKPDDVLVLTLPPRGGPRP